MEQPLYRKIIIGAIIIFLLIVGFLVYLKIRSNGGSGGAASSTATSTGGNPFGGGSGGGSAATPTPGPQNSTTFTSSNSGGSSPYGNGASGSGNSPFGGGSSGYGSTGSGGSGNTGGSGDLSDSSDVTAPPGNAPSSFSSGNSISNSSNGAGNSSYPGSYLYSAGGGNPTGLGSGNNLAATNSSAPITHSTAFFDSVPINGYSYASSTATYSTSTTSGTSTTTGGGTFGNINCGVNCIQGYKIPLGSIGEGQTLTLDQKQTIKTNPYAFTNLTPGLHAVSVTVPTGWFVGYTLCINNTGCHNNVPIAASGGNGVVLNFLAMNGSIPSQTGTIINVPANSYVDLYWHYSQNANDFATTPTIDSGGTLTDPGSPTPGQALSYTGGPKSSFDDSALADAAKNAAACIIANDIKGTVSSVISKALSSILPDKVPTNTVSDFSKTGTFIYGIQVLPSWDSVAYCIVNATIVYITQATIQWVNTAFDGNPAFVQDLARFGADIADQEAIQFFGQLRTQAQGTGAAPFAGAVYQGLVNQYNSLSGGGAYGPTQYTLGQYSPNPQAFTSGTWNQGGYNAWYNMTQNPANNIYGASQIARDQLYGSIQSRQAGINQQLQWGNGFLPIQTCANPQIPSTCKVTTPGNLIINAFTKNTGLAQDRIVNANTFDQAINGLVNTLVQVSLNKILGTPGQ